MLSEQTVYSWRKHFNGLEPNDVKRFNALDMRTMPSAAGPRHQTHAVSRVGSRR
jgi:hypothetical protein